jgi:hypothetical protein
VRAIKKNGPAYRAWIRQGQPDILGVPLEQLLDSADEDS